MPSNLTVVLVSLLLVTPIVMFWLWLVIEGARIAILCPEECEFDPARYEVSCHGSSITTVPLILECHLLEVLRSCQNRNIDTGDWECDTPREVEGMRLCLLEKGQLLEGNIQYYINCNHTSYSSTDIDGRYTERETDKNVDTEDKYTETEIVTEMGTNNVTEAEMDKDTDKEDTQTDTERETDKDMETEKDTDTEQNDNVSSFLTKYQVPV
jgi:hypothetical protein